MGPLASLFWNMSSLLCPARTVCALVLMSWLWCHSLQPTVCCHGEGRPGRNMRHVLAVPTAIIKTVLSSAPPLVCTAATQYINYPAPPLCHSPVRERRRKISKARPKNKAALYVLRVLTSTQMTHFSISKGLWMGGRKRRRRGGKKGGSSEANHVNLKQATHPGGFLFLFGAMPYCLLFFHPAPLLVVIELAPLPFLHAGCVPPPMCSLACC